MSVDPRLRKSVRTFIGMRFDCRKSRSPEYRAALDYWRALRAEFGADACDRELARQRQAVSSSTGADSPSSSAPA